MEHPEMRNQPPELPATAFAILALLTFGEGSGHDLLALARQRLRFFFWNPAKSHVYSELRRLADRGLVAGRDIAQEDRPDKTVFRITRAGEEVLRAWLVAPAPG